MDRGAWRATYSPWGRKESDMTEQITLTSKHQKIWYHGEPSAGASGGSSRSLGTAAPNPHTSPCRPPDPLSSLDVSEPQFRGISPAKGSISGFCFCLMLVSRRSHIACRGNWQGALQFPHCGSQWDRGKKRWLTWWSALLTSFQVKPMLPPVQGSLFENPWHTGKENSFKVRHTFVSTPWFYHYLTLCATLNETVSLNLIFLICKIGVCGDEMR